MPNHQITFGLPGEKLDSVINRFVAAAKDDPFSSWLILPTERLVWHVSHSLIGKNVPFITSRICTLDGFCKTLFEENRTTERFVSKSEAKFLINQILTENPGKFSFFVTRDRPSPGTISDLQQFLNVIIRRKVAFPECLVELQSRKSDQLNDIFTGYQNRMMEENLYDGDTILRWTIDHLERGDSSAPGSVFVYGFRNPLPLEQDLIHAIRDHAGEVSFFVPDGLDANIFRAHNGTGQPPAFDPTTLPARITGLFSENGALESGDHFRAGTFPTPYAEMYAIAAEIRRLCAGGVPLSDIAVAFPEIRENLSLIDEVFLDYGIPWNTSVGPKLSRARVIQFILGIASLASEGHSREGVVRLVGSPYFRNTLPGGSSFLDPSEVDLVSRHAQIDDPHLSWTRSLEWLSRELRDPEKAKNFRGISGHAVDRVREGTDILISDLDELARPKSLTDHSVAFKQFLEKWKIPQLSSDLDETYRENESRLITKFLARLDNLAHAPWISTGKIVSAADFSHVLRALADESDEKPWRDDDGVVVLGIRECEHMQFPILFLGGLVEGAIPSLTTRLPFTNALENSRMGTRSLSEILREGEYYFIAALLSGQKRVYLSAPLADGEKVLLTSAFFERVRARAGDCPWPMADEEGILASQRTAAIRAGESIRDGTICTATGLVPASLDVSDLTERINMERYHRTGACDSVYDGILSGDESIREALTGRYGPDHVYSPTSLEIYAGCPFAYFLNRVTGLQALPDVEANLPAGDRGTAIHEVLSTFYRQWRSAGHATVSLASLNDATDLILRIATETLDRYSFQSPIWDATRILMLGDPHTGPGYFGRFLACEAEEEESLLVPTRFEFSFGMGTTEPDDPASVPEPVEILSAESDRKMLLRGRIDRIDLTTDGQFVIYDYKSGSQHPKAKDIEAGTALQLPLYLLAFEKISGHPGIGGGYYTIRREVGRSMVLVDSAAKDLMISRPRPSKDFPGLIHHARDAAFASVDGIRTGRFPLPCEEKCPNPYCEFKRICRFDPYRVFTAGEET